MKMYKAVSQCISCGDTCRAKATSEDDAVSLLWAQHDCQKKRPNFQEITLTDVREDDEPTPRRAVHDNSSVNPPPKRPRR